MISPLLLAAALASAAPKLEPVEPTVSGFPPKIEVSDLDPDDRVRIWTVRTFSKWQEVDGRWLPVPVELRAWADFEARGTTLDTRTAQAIAGTYRGVDPYGLLWSGREPSDSLVANATQLPAFEAGKDGTGVVIVQVDGREVGRAALSFASPPGLRTEIMRIPGVVGVYAAPDDGQKHPTLLLLHGSEGGNMDDARALAERFAGQGFAALSVIYFAWDLAKVEGVSSTHLNTPIELLEQAKSWAIQQPEADASRIGVYGHSKGAEFAEVAAIRYPWIKAVAACVPTDVVWEGYGHDDERNTTEHRYPKPAIASSWSYQGEPLPYVKLRPFKWGAENPYFTNTERYELSRADDAKGAELAVIPIERSEAKFLLLGGEKDEVWASGEMTEALVKRFEGLPASRRPEAHVFAGAGHQICGDGTFPPRVYGSQSDDPRAKDLDLEGQAAARVWPMIVDFFRRTLK